VILHAFGLPLRWRDAVAFSAIGLFYSLGLPGSAGGDASTNYHITTNMENVGGNYSKLDFKWFTGQRFYAHYVYGGFRFKEITTGDTLFSVGEGDLHVRATNILYAGNSVRAPIFYDTDNTSYYLDPHNGSNLYTTKFNTATNGAAGRTVVIKDATVSEILFGNYPGGWTSALQIQNNDNSDFVWISPLDVNNNARFRAGGCGLDFYTDGANDAGTHSLFVGSGYAQGVVSLRAPIFYDSDNTAYYLDASTWSSFYGLAIRGDQSASDSGNQIFFWGAGDTTTSAIGFKASAGEFVSPTGAGDGYNTYLTMDTDGRGWVFRRGTGSNDFTSAFTSGWILNNGIWQAQASMRSPIFYDSNDTTYFFDGASTSRLNQARFQNRISVGDGSGTPFLNSGSPGVWLSFNGGSDIFMGSESSTSAGFYLGDWRFRVNSSGVATASNDFRAPIFYDSNNTGFYFDGASTTNLNDLIITRNIASPSNYYADLQFEVQATSGTAGIGLHRSGYSHCGIYHDTSDVLKFNFNSATVTLNAGAGSLIGTGNDETYIRLRDAVTSEDWNTYIDGSEASYRIVTNGSGSNRPGAYMYGVLLSMANAGQAKFQLYAPHNGTDGNGLWVRTGWDTDYDAWNQIAIQSASFANNVDLRAPIFYDNNDTAYFANPNGRSRLLSMDYGNGDYYFAGGDWGYRHNTPYGWIQFGPANSGHAHIYTDRSNFYFNAQIQLLGGSLINQTDIRSAIFYDTNDTGRYFDPNGTSFWNTSQQNGWHYFNSNYGHGVVGLYASTRFQCVYAMGDAYKGNADGTSLSGAYGLWWSYPSAGGPAASLGSHGLMCIVNGTNVAQLDTSTQANGDMRAPIFYDRNDTTYFVDPNASTSLRTVGDWRSNSSGWTGEFSGKIQYHDNSWYIQGANRFIFRNASGAEPFTVNQGGTALATADMRTPIFYDSADTSYYLNPNGYSSLYTARFWGNEVLIRGGSPTLFFQDADEMSAMLHCNSNLFYLLRGGTDSTSWATAANGMWPVYWNLGNNDATFGGAITAAGNITAYSDAKLKENVETITSALDKTLSLRGVYYNLINDKTKTRKLGVVAQEVQKVIPEVVMLHQDKEDPEGTLAVDYGNMVGLLIEAIKELKAEIEMLKAR
jgi:hypothetical protein